MSLPALLCLSYRVKTPEEGLNVVLPKRYDHTNQNEYVGSNIKAYNNDKYSSEELRKKSRDVNLTAKTLEFGSCLFVMTARIVDILQVGLLTQFATVT